VRHVRALSTAFGRLGPPMNNCADRELDERGLRVLQGGQR
jgi:hypothetical protein